MAVGSPDTTDVWPIIPSQNQGNTIRITYLAHNHNTYLPCSFQAHIERLPLS